ncbi:flagellar biosynthetic protein FliO [Sporosarcina jiandibaonis]|uniref:flagellar biosynthetic protein FliO n=1 Tax=Sporosarcina jiandibaonis TaxID=2715535 RepID=UPI001553FF71|nr:flagellar biosynthetic protein FliO [Sporosarcina jiandibaonis]
MIRKISKCVLIISLFFLLVALPISVNASEPNVNDWINDEKSQPQPGQLEKEESIDLNTTNTSITKIIGKLILYTFLILILIYALIKFLALRQKNLQPNQAIKLMGGTPLGNNKSLQLVKVGDQLLLIGVGDQVTLLKEFLNEDEIKSIEENLTNQPSDLSNSLTNFIKEKINDRKKKSNSFENIFSQSLDKIKGKQDQFEQDVRKKDDEEGRL